VSTAAPSSLTGSGAAIDTSRLASRANLDAAGQKFEAVFTGMMLKSMRSAKLGDGLLDSDAGTQFRDMQDQLLAQTMAERTPIGIGKAMTDFLAKSEAGQASLGSAGDEGSTS
jgi:peptidoglycan hydrolase FlgJ